MICERCHGKGKIKARVFGPVRSEWVWDPCPDCHGSGIVACCEGSQRHANLEEEK